MPRAKQLPTPELREARTHPPDFEMGEDATLISPDRCQGFWKLLEEADFWSLPSWDNSGENTRDGAMWVLEVLEGGHYHLIERWCLDDGSLRRAALGLLELAGVRVQDSY